MKLYPVILFFLSLFVISCNDDLTDLGIGIRPTSDSIAIGTDTFHVSTENDFVSYIISRPDSFLLGTFFDEKFGTTQADILAQLQGPIGINFKYPENSVPDSAVLRLYYRSWIGDNYSPMEISIYEMKGQKLEFSKPYKTNLDSSLYCGDKILLGKTVVTAKDATKTTTSTNISIRLDGDDFVKRFFAVTPETFSTQTNYFNFFKGIYISSNFGSSTLLNISRIDLQYYFHYKYLITGDADSTKVSNVLTFPANSEVRQVNRFIHPDSTIVRQKLALVDSVNYASSPANIQTKVILPLKRMQDRIKAKIKDKQQALNSALLNVEVTDVDDRLLPQPIVKYMLLIKKDSVDNFFSNGKLPSDTYAILAPYAASLISNTSLYKRYYSFNVAKLIANEFKLNKSIDNDFEMMLVPVRVTFDSSNNVTGVKQEFLMSSVVFRSGRNALSPMRINMVYSGF